MSLAAATAPQPALTGMKPNPGFLPDDARGQRVRVRLEHGGLGRCDDSAPKPGWDANSCRWARTGSPFDIKEYEVVK